MTSDDSRAAKRDSLAAHPPNNHLGVRDQGFGRDSEAGATPDVSILILSWNTHDLTLQGLDSIPSGVNDNLTYEVIVVDNGSRDGSAETLSQRSDIHLILNNENRGYAAGVNQAYRLSRGRLVLLLNSDVQLGRGAISELARFLEENPNASGVGPLYKNPDGSHQPQHARLPTFTMALSTVSGVFGRLPPFMRTFRDYTMLDEDFSQPRPVPQPAASCLMLRRSSLPDHRLLDERFPIYFNDVELAHRLASAGKTLWMTPAAVVVHALGSSTSQLGIAQVRHHIGSLVRYFAMTEPAYKLLLFRVVVAVEQIAKLILRHRRALPVRDLVNALRGDPGPVPQSRARDT